MSPTTYKVGEGPVKARLAFDAAVGGAVVGVVAAAALDVVVATVGEAGDPDGAAFVMPLGTVLFGYAVQVSVSGLPDTSSVRVADWFTVKVIGPPDAVKGPMVPAGEGTSRFTPELGTGVPWGGRGELKLIEDDLTSLGVAPLASICTSADPLTAVLPSD
jgi:hypothetical protein